MEIAGYNARQNISVGNRNIDKVTKKTQNALCRRIVGRTWNLTPRCKTSGKAYQDVRRRYCLMAAD